MEEIKAGQVWRRRDGALREIASVAHKLVVDRFGATYALDGKCRTDGVVSQYDLVQLACVDDSRDELGPSVDDIRGDAPSPYPPLKDEGEHTGLSVNYYKVRVENPTSGGEPYDPECNDIIEALGMTFAEGNVFKAVWRIAAARRGLKKRGNDGVYDAEKIVFFGQRLIVQEQA